MHRKYYTLVLLLFAPEFVHAEEGVPQKDPESRPITFYLGASIGLESWNNVDHSRYTLLGLIGGVRLTDQIGMDVALTNHPYYYLASVRFGYHLTALPGFSIGPKLAAGYSEFDGLTWGSGVSASYDIRLSRSNVIGAELSVMKYGLTAVTGTLYWKYFLF